MRIYLYCLFAVCLFTCTQCNNSSKSSVTTSSLDTASINNLIDQWHLAAANADFNQYFNCMSADAVFIGTDPTEHWNIVAFKAFCKPYFEKGKAWNFKSLNRNIYSNPEKNIVWFDELLNTQMKICRGSGVLIQEDGKWKIAHYVLSMTIPNENTNEVVALKTLFENRMIDSLNKK